MSQDIITPQILRMPPFQQLEQQCATGEVEASQVFRRVQELCVSNTDIQELLIDIPESKRKPIYGQITAHLRAFFPQNQVSKSKELNVSTLPMPLYNLDLLPINITT